MHINGPCRLSFNEELAKPLTLLRNPYHLAAIKGNIALAAFLHQRGVGGEAPLALKCLPEHGVYSGVKS